MANERTWFDGFESAFHDVDGVRMFARIGGRIDAPPLLLLHGFPQTHAMWQRVAQRLAPHFRLVLPDLRGYGDSGKPPGDPDHAPLPERLIGADPRFYLHASLGGWGSRGHIEPQALSDYERCFGVPETIHAACEDYRASAGIDLEHDRASRAASERIACDLLVLWGERGVVQRLFNPLALWRAQCAGSVSGHAMPAGHFIPEELPEETAQALLGFFGA